MAYPNFDPAFFLSLFRVIGYNAYVVVCSRFPLVFRSASRNRGTSAKPRSSAFNPAPGVGTSRLEINSANAIHVRRVNKSSPRLAARDGMEQGPYEFPTHAFAPAFGAKGLRRRTQQSASLSSLQRI